MYRTALKHKVGRELCYDIFYLLADTIEKVPSNVKSKEELGVLLSDIETLKEIARDVCRVIIRHEQTKHEDGKDFFTTEQWKELYDKCKTEKFKVERGAIEKGRAFVTAYNTPMGKAIDALMLHAVQNGYEAISKGDIDMKGIYRININRTVSLRWEEKIQAYKKNIERVRKIIYKEN